MSRAPATPRKLPSGLWCLQQWSPPDGNGVSKRLFVSCPPTNNSPAFARELMRQAIDRHVRGTPTTRHTFASFVDERFLVEYPAARGLRSSTLLTLRAEIERAMPHLGALPLPLVDAPAVARMVAALKSGATGRARAAGPSQETRDGIARTVAALCAWSSRKIKPDTSVAAATEMWLADEWLTAKTAAETGPARRIPNGAFWKETRKIPRATILRLKRARFYLSRFVVPALGTEPVGLISPETLPERAFQKARPAWLTRRALRRGTRVGPRRALSEQTIRHIVVAVKSVLRWAHQTREIGQLPTIPTPRVSEPRTPRPYSVDEERALIAAAADDEERALFLISFDTGIRKSELFGLTWAQVDWEARELIIDRQRYRGDERQTKSGKARKIQLSETLEQLLKSIRHLRAPYVFCDETGAPLTDGSLRATFERAVERAGLRKVRWHDHRHTFASVRVAEGESVFGLRQALGHSDTRTTQRYVHVAQAARPRSVLE